MTRGAIPGLRLRPFDPATDYGPLAELYRTVHLHDGLDWLPSEEVLRDELSPSPRFEPATDVFLAEVDGRLVAAGDTSWRQRPGSIWHEVGPRVHPEWRRRGLGRMLLERTEARAREVAAGSAESGARWLVAFVEDAAPRAPEFAAAAGYTPSTFGFLMRRPLDRPIEPAPMPSGSEVRPVRPEDHRAIWDADVDAFLDHPEPAVRDESDFQHWFAQTGIDTSLWRVAWAGDEVAGSVMNFIWADENQHLGIRRAWLEHVSVRRPWRGRGLARALITQSLEMLRDAGFEDAMLGVVADNPTGAVGLYERCGFEVHRRWTQWRKPLTG